MQEKIIETIDMAHEKPLHASGDARKRWVQRAPSGEDIMKRFILILFALFFLTAYNNQCKNKSICVRITKHINNKILALCLSIKNNQDRNIYLSPGSWFFNVKKEYNGTIYDAMDDAYGAIPHADSGLSMLDNLSKNDKQCNCGKSYRGPVYEDDNFRLKVANELFYHISPLYRTFAFNHHYGRLSFETESEFADTNQLDREIKHSILRNMHCLFIPAKEVIIMHWNIDLEQIQFVYPNNFRDLYYLKQNNNPTTSLKNQIDSCIINYPKTILGYELYKDSIKSDVLEINNPNK